MDRATLAWLERLRHDLLQANAKAVAARDLYARNPADALQDDNYRFWSGESGRIAGLIGGYLMVEHEMGKVTSDDSR